MTILAVSKVIRPRCKPCSMTGSRRRSFPPSAGPAAPLPVPEVQIAPPRRKHQQQASRRALRPRRAPDAQTIEKSRGRLEIRELWAVAAGELGPYLADEYGWQVIAQVGWLRRWSQRRPGELWTVEEVTVVSSQVLAPAQFLDGMRQHWSIENKLHWPRDMSMHEDRLHGRAIGVILAVCRNVVLNLIRRHLPGRFVPDARSTITTDLRIPLRWMHHPLRN